MPTWYDPIPGRKPHSSPFTKDSHYSTASSSSAAVASTSWRRYPEDDYHYAAAAGGASSSSSSSTARSCSLASLPSPIIQRIARHLLAATAERVDPEPPSRAVEVLNRYDRETRRLSGNSSSSDERWRHDVDEEERRERAGRARRVSGASNAVDDDEDATTAAAAAPAPFMIARPLKIQALLATCRATYDALSHRRNPGFWARIHEQTFDTAAIRRRWNRSNLPVEQVLANSDFRMDDAALTRDYVDRMTLLRKMKAVARYQSLDVDCVSRRADLEDDLWKLWWIVSENDGRNVHILRHVGCIAQWSIVVYHTILLPDAVAPGYPPMTTEKALFNWIVYRLGLDRGLEHSSESMDEKIFLHRAWVFGCHRYPVLIAPWIFRNLPITSVAKTDEDLILMSRPNAFMHDLTPRKQSVSVERFGRQWQMVPPGASVEASALMLMGMVDRFPEIATLARKPEAPQIYQLVPSESWAGSSARSSEGDRDAKGAATAGRSQSFSAKSNVVRPSIERAATERPQAAAAAHAAALTHRSSSGKAKASASSSPPATIESTEYDADFVRSMSCLSPIDSRGLPPLFYRHRVEGTWRGKYLYLDFDAYRSVLAGNLRSLYDGAFGSQDQEWTLEERVINVKIDRVGGDGSSLTAGYRLDDDLNETPAYDPNEDPEIRGWEPCTDERAPDRPGWTKEILISGSGHSSWGNFDVKGRVRSWDGLVTLWCHYSGIQVGKWLWRGYLHAGGLHLGRWRDTFTPESIRAFEGPFAMMRVDGPVYDEVQREINARSKGLTQARGYGHPDSIVESRHIAYESEVREAHAAPLLGSIAPPRRHQAPARHPMQPPRSMAHVPPRGPAESNLRGSIDQDELDIRPALPPIHSIAPPPPSPHHAAAYRPRATSDTRLDRDDATAYWSRSLASGHQAPERSPSPTSKRSRM